MDLSRDNNYYESSGEVQLVELQTTQNVWLCGKGHIIIYTRHPGIRLNAKHPDPEL